MPRLLLGSAFALAALLRWLLWNAVVLLGTVALGFLLLGLLFHS